ncbi:MAG: PAS domain-containing sensor histidine kinase, partial [Caenispirillum bisanense]|nr:PAS domain-containing sensor histidine kinase [Caenispirillum bisanense]MCA1972932.1 PAS domain-containing sensor histidine kinase [Caenispirillum sp.]
MTDRSLDDTSAPLAAALLDSAPDCVLEVTPDLTVRYVNTTARHLGVTPGARLGQSLTGPLWDEVAALCRRVLAGGEAGVADLLHPADRTPLSVRAFPCRTGVGLFMRSLGPNDPPSAEHRRKMAEAQLEALFANAPAGFSFFDRDLRFVRVNPWLADINGIPVADHIGRTKHELLPELVDRIAPIIEQVFATGQGVPLTEMRGRTAARPGVDRDWLVGFFPVVVDGEVVYVGCVVTEITALRAAERERATLADALERERRLLRTAMEHLPIGVVVAQGPDGRIVLRNDEAERLLGHPLTEQAVAMAEPQSLGGIHADGRPFEAADYPLYQSLTGGDTVHGVEIAYRRGDGRLTTFSVNAAPIQSGDGHPALAVAAFHDISHRKAMEDALRLAKEEAERADLAKSRFLAAASHDLRQPIQSLFFFAEALRSHLDGAEGEAKLANLHRGLDALKGLLDSLLDVSRLDANMVEPQITVFDLDDLFDEVEAAYATIARDQGLTLSVARGCGLVRSDRTLLGRIVRNLVENALRYTAKGTITVECAPSGEQRLRIAVADTGIGIPPEHISRIWEEFHQVGNPERARERGLGLGLAIVRRLSSLLDHPVTVESRAGEGSRFAVDVPAVMPAEGIPAHPPEAAVPPARPDPAAG